FAGLVVLGSVRLMNSSSTGLAPGVGWRPVNGSVLAVARPSGCLKSLIAQVRVAPAMKPCQTNVVTSLEKTGRFGDTTELSLLPFHAPTARACSPADRPFAAGGAMQP